MRPLLKTQEKDFQFQSKNKFSKIKKEKKLQLKGRVENQEYYGAPVPIKM